MTNEKARGRERGCDRPAGLKQTEPMKHTTHTAVDSTPTPHTVERLAGSPMHTQEVEAVVDAQAAAAGVGGGAAPPVIRGVGLPGPPLVIRGANKVETKVGVDWIAFSCESVSGLQRVVDELTLYFGVPERKGIMNFYDERYVFGNKAQVMFDHEPRNGKGMFILLPGQALADFGDVETTLRMLRSLFIGRRCTRLDLRLDMRSTDPGGVGLIESVEDSCRRGELCHCRMWAPVALYEGGSKLKARGVNLGRRGSNGSGRYVRVYDKGLETHEAEVGEWERWETEMSGDVANEVALQLLEKEGQFTAENVMRYALGAVAFHEVVAGETALAERPLAEWWRVMLDSLKPVLVVATRAPKTLERYAAWLRNVVAPLLESMGRRTGQTIGSVFEDLVGDDIELPKHIRLTVITEFVEFVRNRATSGVGCAVNTGLS